MSERDRSKDKNGGKKKSGRGWALRVFVLAVVLSALLSFFSTTALAVSYTHLTLPTN